MAILLKALFHFKQERKSLKELVCIAMWQTTGNKFVTTSWQKSRLAPIHGLLELRDIVNKNMTELLRTYDLTLNITDYQGKMIPLCHKTDYKSGIQI